MFKINKCLLLLAISLLMLMAMPSGFANEMDSNFTLGDDSISAENTNSYYFDASAADDNGNGSFDNPYKYLTADRIKDNSNIYLANGEYELDASKVANRVNIYGSDVNLTVIKHNGKAFVANSLSLNNLTLLCSTVEVNSIFNATNTIFDGGSGSKNYGYGNHYGGAVYTPDSSGGYVINIRDCIFKNNHAEYGGAISIFGGNLNIINSLFINNYAYNFGGAISAQFSSSNVNISKSRFVNSSSLADAGGTIYARSAVLTLRDVEIINSSATFGGGITSLSTRVSIDNLTAFNNTAKYDGGAIYHMYGEFSLVNSNFENNSACNAGALLVDGSSNLYLNSNSFTSNTANFTAGAIYSICNTLNASDSLRQNNTFHSNRALFRDDEYEITSINLAVGNGSYAMYKYIPSDTGDLPAYYNLYDHALVTVVKDQQDGGNCWAFAPIAVLESNILKASGQIFDLSEENMKNVIAKFSDYGWDMDTNNGGHDSMQIGYLTSWLGPVLDSDDVYDDKSTLSPILNSVAHVQNVVFLNRDNYTDNDEIKKAILQYGAVGTSMYYNDTYRKRYEYNYYYSGSNPSNHAVTIVGWDDNFSKNRFSGNPAGNGAWIVRNSWAPSWGYDGYFYVSYYDTRLAQPGVQERSYTFILNDTIRYDKNYQYDIAGKTDYYYFANDTVWYRNVFHATDDEYLAGISTYFEKITNWTSAVYLNGQCVLIKNGTSDKGYYTIDLGDFIHLNQGDIFEVEFKIFNGGDVGVPISEEVSLNKLTYGPEMSYVSLDGVNWEDLYYKSGSYPGHSYYSQVACIKAFTYLNKINTVLNLHVSDDKVIAQVIDEFENLVNGNVTFNINGDDFDVALVNGIADLTYVFNRSINSLSAFFNKTGYMPAQNSTEYVIPVTQVNLLFNVSKFLNAASVNITSSGNINQSLTLQINGEDYTINLTNGQCILNLENLTNGEYEFKYAYDMGLYNYTLVNPSFFIHALKTRLVAYDVVVNDNSTVLFNVTLLDESNQTLSGKEITFKINDMNYTNLTDDYGAVSLPLNLTFGNYNMLVEFAGDEELYSAGGVYNIKVKTDIEIGVNLESSFNNVILNVELSKPANTTVMVDLNNQTYIVKAVNGKARLIMNNLSNGYYEGNVGLSDDFYFNESNFSFTIDFTSPDLNVTLADDFKTLTISVDENAGGNASVKLDGRQIKNISLESDSKIINLENLSAGFHIIEVNYSGSGKYLPESRTIEFEILKKDSDINVRAPDIREKRDLVVDIEVTDGATGLVLVKIGDIRVFNTLEEGKTTISVKNLMAGNYTVNVSYLGDEYFKKSSKTVNVTVKAKETPQINVTLGEVVSVILPDGAEGNVSVRVNGMEIANSIPENGILNVSLGSLAPGEYVIEVAYSGDENYTAVSETETLVVEKMTSVIDVDVNEPLEGETVIFDINITGPVQGVVLVDIGGGKYYGMIEDGKAIVRVADLPAGNYSAYFVYGGDEYYKNSSKTVDVLVKAIEIPEISVEVDSNVSVTLPDDADGYVIIKVNGRVFANDTLKNGVLNISLGNLTPGEYLIDVVYSGNEKYASAGKTETLVVEKMKSVIGVDVNEIAEGETLTLDINITDGASGVVLVDIGGGKYYGEIDGGKATVNVMDLSAGNYSAVVSYAGDSNYENSIEYVNVTVKAVEPVPEPVTPEIDVDFDENVFVCLPVNATGNVTVKVNGKSAANALVENGVVNVSLGSLAPGEYVIEVIYSGDNQYASAGKTETLVVEKMKSVIGVGVNEIAEGETLTLDINITGGASGIVLVDIGGGKYYGEIDGGKATVNVMDLSAGNYSAVVSYAGDGNYENSIEYVNVTVKAVEPVPEPVTPEIDVDFDENVFVCLPVNATGNVTVKVNGKSAANALVENGVVNVSLGSLAPGEYVIEVIYSGDDQYAAITENGTLIILKKESVIGVDVNEIAEGETLAFDINITEGATGVVLVDINDVKAYGEIKNGSAIVNIYNLACGNYTAVISYLGDEYFKNSSATINVTVKAIEPAFEPVAPEINITVNESVLISLPDDARGSVAVKVNGEEIANVTIKNSILIIPLDNLTPNNYIIEVIYSGDNQYLPANEISTLTVGKKESAMEVHAPQITEGEALTFDINITCGATGVVLIDINARKAYGEISGGKAIVNVDGLAAGNYTASVSYAGDDNYKNTMYSLEVIVNSAALPPEPVNPDINVTLSDGVSVKLPENAGGNVTVIVDGCEIASQQVKNGTSNIPLNDLSAGKHVIEVKYSGDDNYNPKNVTKFVTVEKNHVDIKIETDEITEGETLTFDITITEGTTGVVLIDINGKKSYGEIKDGKATVNVDGLAAGNYTATVTYPSDDNFENASVTVEVNVRAVEVIPDKIIPDLNVSIHGSSISADLPEDARGNVSIRINNREIANVAVENGIVNVSAGDLKPNEYVVEVIYSGDNRYSSKTEIDTFAIFKKESSIFADADEITEGEAMTFNIDVCESAGGFVLLDVDGKKAYGEIRNGRAVVNVYALPAGLYAATVTYCGDDYYENSSTTVNVSVKAVEMLKNPQMNVTVGDGVIIGLPGDASGNVTVKVDEKEMACSEVNGTVKIPLENLTSGSHLVEVIYSGDGKYSSAYNASIKYVEQKASKKDTFISVDNKFSRVANDWDAGERGAFFYAVLKDCDGNVLVNKTVQIAVNGPIYNVTTDEMGRAGLQVNLANANTYTYALAFTGDSQYNAAPLASSKLTVTKKSISISASNARIKAKSTNTITVTLKAGKNPYDGKSYLSAGKKITLKVNGKTYSAKANAKGIAKFAVKINKKGKYAASVKFAGDKTYKAASKSVNIAVY